MNFDCRTIIDRYYVKSIPGGVLFFANIILALFGFGFLVLVAKISPTAAAVLFVMMIVRNLIYMVTLLTRYLLSIPAQPATVVMVTSLVLIGGCVLLR